MPLRASASEILTEQTIGRGLRLPYGKRIGVEAVGRLTIIAHNRFQEIFDRANEHAIISNNKLWFYLLVPHDAIALGISLANLKAAYSLAIKRVNP